jgi:hypothetical protein
MRLIEIVNDTINEFIDLSESWYHGTPDAREVENSGGFLNKTVTVDYINDLDGYYKIMEEINKARLSGDSDLYFRLLDKVSIYKSDFKYNKPIFLSNSYSVAHTYADPKRAFDYQSAVEKVYEVDVVCNKIVKIVATGERFRFLSIDKVKQGFINSGVDENEINQLILMFNYYISGNKGIKTDVIAAIGNWLKFDCIDVVGVLDSYQGGTIKSTVKIVLNPNNIKIK